jgi:hypothetical protein
LAEVAAAAAPAAVVWLAAAARAVVMSVGNITKESIRKIFDKPLDNASTPLLRLNHERRPASRVRGMWAR